MMKTLPLPLPLPLPGHLSPLPPLLTFGQVVELTVFWNLGGRHYVEELRECGVLVSVNNFPRGRRARYAAAAVLGLYPVGIGKG